MGDRSRGRDRDRLKRKLLKQLEEDLLDYIQERIEDFGRDAEEGENDDE